MLAALRFAGGLGTWMLYSRIVKMAVQPAARSNAIVSQTRLEGNATIMQQLAESMPSTQINASKYDTLVWGTNDACSGGNVKKLGKYLILDSSDENSLSIFASCKIPQESLRTLIGSKRRGRLWPIPFNFESGWKRSLTVSQSSQHSIYWANIASPFVTIGTLKRSVSWNLHMVVLVCSSFEAAKRIQRMSCWSMKVAIALLPDCAASSLALCSCALNGKERSTRTL